MWCPYHLSYTSGVSWQKLNSTADLHLRECYFVYLICSSFSNASQTYGTLFFYLSSSVEHELFSLSEISFFSGLFYQQLPSTV